MDRLYKTLFDVKLMHEYYLTREDGSVPFTILLQPQRLNFLMEEFIKDRDTITRDLHAVFPAGLLQYYSGLELKVLPSYSGFRVVCQVYPVKQPDQSVYYKPVKALPANPGIIIQLIHINNSLNHYTGGRLTRAIPGDYFFSNEPQLNNATHPYLTAPIAPQTNQYLYEQGELAAFGAGDIREYYLNGAGAQWAKVQGSDFANENDRILIAPSFRYHFQEAAGLAAAEFVLKDHQNEVAGTIKVQDNGGIVSSQLNFSAVPVLNYLDSQLPVEQRMYTLEVTGSGNFSKTHKLIFTRGARGNEWAAVHFQPYTSNPLFNLLDGEGFLVTRLDALGNRTAPPVFEIPVKSRSAFLRYKNTNGNAIGLVAELNQHLEKQGNTLVSLVPKSVTLSNFKLLKPDQTIPKYVPHPPDYELHSDQQRRLYFDIRVPESALFPVT